METKDKVLIGVGVAVAGAVAVGLISAFSKPTAGGLQGHQPRIKKPARLGCGKCGR